MADLWLVVIRAPRLVTHARHATLLRFCRQPLLHAERIWESLLSRSIACLQDLLSKLRELQQQGSGGAHPQEQHLTSAWAMHAATLAALHNPLPSNRSAFAGGCLPPGMLPSTLLNCGSFSASNRWLPSSGPGDTNPVDPQSYATLANWNGAHPRPLQKRSPAKASSRSHISHQSAGRQNHQPVAQQVSQQAPVMNDDVCQEVLGLHAALWAP